MELWVIVVLSNSFNHASATHPFNEPWNCSNHALVVIERVPQNEDPYTSDTLQKKTAIFCSVSDVYGSSFWGYVISYQSWPHSQVLLLLFYDQQNWISGTFGIIVKVFELIIIQSYTCVVKTPVHVWYTLSSDLNHSAFENHWYLLSKKMQVWLSHCLNLHICRLEDYLGYMVPVEMPEM